MANPGDRVGAILSANKEFVELLGYGVYLGDLQPPCGPFGVSLEEYHATAIRVGFDPAIYLNPCIQRDDGRYVWGFQCWWGDADRVREAIENRVIKMVSIESLEPLPQPEA